MAGPALRPDLLYAERLAGMADSARGRGQSACADRLLLLAWGALDDAGPEDTSTPRSGARILPIQV